MKLLLLDLRFQLQDTLIFSPANAIEKAHAQQRIRRRPSLYHQRLDAQHVDRAHFEAIELYAPGLRRAARRTDYDLLARDAEVDAQPACPGSH